MKRAVKISFFVYVVINIFSTVNIYCQDINTYYNDIKTAVESTKQKLCPDKRLGIFEVEVTLKKKDIILTGELSEHLFYNEIVNSLTEFKEKVKIKNEIILLPEEKLQYKYAIASSGVVDLHREPDENSELLTQAILGQEFSLYKKKEDWYLAKLDKDYIGWINLRNVHLCNKEDIYNWNKQVNISVSSNFAEYYDKPFIKQNKLGTLVIGTRIRLIRNGALWSKVLLPDNREVWIKTKNLREFDPEKFNRMPKGEDFIKTGIRFLGIPYLWGGKSPFGFDCSGYVKTVFMLNGIDLPRDANMQALCGRSIEIDENYSYLKTGDLLFFGRNRVTHVGIYIKDGWYIHSSGYVRINNLKNDRDAYVEHRSATLLHVRRIID